MKSIKVSPSQNKPSEELTSEMMVLLKEHISAGKLSKKNFEVLKVELAKGDISELHVYDKYIDDHNRFCGGACTTVYRQDMGYVWIQRVKVLTSDIIIGANDDYDDPFSVGLLSQVSGRCKQNQFAATVTYNHKIRKDQRVTKIVVIKSLHVYLG